MKTSFFNSKLMCFHFYNQATNLYIFGAEKVPNYIYLKKHKPELKTEMGSGSLYLNHNTDSKILQATM